MPGSPRRRAGLVPGSPGRRAESGRDMLLKGTTSQAHEGQTAASYPQVSHKSASGDRMSSGHQSYTRASPGQGPVTCMSRDSERPTASLLKRDKIRILNGYSLCKYQKLQTRNDFFPPASKRADLRETAYPHGGSASL